MPAEGRRTGSSKGFKDSKGSKKPELPPKQKPETAENSITSAGKQRAELGTNAKFDRLDKLKLTPEVISYRELRRQVKTSEQHEVVKKYLNLMQSLEGSKANPIVKEYRALTDSFDAGGIPISRQTNLVARPRSDISNDTRTLHEDSDSSDMLFGEMDGDTSKKARDDRKKEIARKSGSTLTEGITNKKLERRRRSSHSSGDERRG